MKNYAVLEGMKRHQKTVLDDAFNKGYGQGYHDGKLDGKAEKIEELEKQFDDEKKAEYKRGYEQGRISMLTIKDFEEIRRSQYDKGYEDGKKLNMNDAYEVGFNQGKKTAEEFNERKAMDEFNKGYQKGLQHGQELRAKEAECAKTCGMKRAWEAARKVMLSPEEGGIDPSTVKEIFGMNYYAVLKNLPVDEVLSKIDGEKEQSEKCCATCGQPRDYKNSCIPYKEGKCDKSHKAWIPKQEQTKKNCDNCKHNNVASGIDGTCYECVKGVQDNYEEKTEKSCEKCKWMELDCANPAICKDMALYEPKDIEEDVKVGDTIRTIKDKDYLNIELFPIGTIGRVIKIESEGNFLRYKVRVGNECWIYSRDMFEVINQDAPESNVGSIAVWDEVEDNIGNRTVVTHIYSDDKYANADVIDADGCCSCIPLELLEKTGRRFCFQELLNAMKKDDVEEADTNENK